MEASTLVAPPHVVTRNTPQCSLSLFLIPHLLPCWKKGKEDHHDMNTVSFTKQPFLITGVPLSTGSISLGSSQQSSSSSSPLEGNPNNNHPIQNVNTIVYGMEHINIAKKTALDAKSLRSHSSEDKYCKLNLDFMRVSRVVSFKRKQTKRLQCDVKPPTKDNSNRRKARRCAKGKKNKFIQTSDFLVDLQTSHLFDSIT